MIPRNDHVADYVDDYLHGLLSAADGAYLARHCADCPACAAALEEARRRLAALRALPPSEAPEELVRATVAGLARYERRRRLRRRYALGAAAAALVTAAAVLAAVQLRYASLTPTPFDLKVLGQTQLLAGSQASLRVQLIKRFPESPGAFLFYAGIPVEITLAPKDGRPPVSLASFRTDSEGSGQPRFQVPDWADADCELVVTAQAPGGPETTRQTVRVKRSWQVMLSSDKPVYQPGQTIRVRSLALRRPDLRPVAGEDVTFTVTDPKGNVVFKQSGPSSAYGIASADCPLAAEVIEGQYVLGCAVGDTTSRLAVQVKPYVLPKFRVGVALDRTFYAPGQKATATVDAAYFFGQPVGGGAVEVEVTVPQLGMKPFHSVGARTDDAGRAVFSFEMPKSLPGPDDVRVTVTARVTDTAGQKQEKAAATVVTSSPLKVEVVPESDTPPRGIKTTVYVFTTYADGRPARTTVKGPDGIQFQTNDLGVGSFEYVPSATSVFALVATDGQGVTATRTAPLAGSSQPFDFLLRTDKAVYEGGDTMKLSAFGDGTVPVFVDVLKDGQTLLTAAIPLAQQRGACDIDLPPELSGTLQLCAYRVLVDGVALRKTRTVFVRPASRLQVQATTDQAEYRPGRRAKLRFQLLDQSGGPVRGALSLAAVDEAVFAVLPQAPGSEARVFGVDEGLLRPVEEFYRWSPDARIDLPPAERNRFEQALFARTARSTSDTLPVLLSGPRRPGAAEDAPALGGSPYSLDASTFAAKAQQVDQARDRGLQRVGIAWLFWWLTAGLVAYVLMWVYVRRPYLIAALHAVGLCLLCGGIMLTTRLPLVPMAMDSVAMSGAKPAAQPPADVEVALPDLVSAPAKADGGTSTRVRTDFPETLLWRPQLITDDDGRAQLDLDLADSITTWRLTAGAVAADGRLGAAQAGIKVFQPFFVDLNLPVSLTRGDEVAVPVVVYNYLDKPQTVELTLAAADWFDCLDGAARKIELAPRAVRSASYRLRVKTVGRHALQVSAKGGDLTDAIRRDIEVVPDGRRVEQVANGSLAESAEVTLTVPENAVEGSAKAFVKIYPSSFSQLVEGLDGIFRRPYGCFEQTSSTTYPNVLALEYLRRTNQAAPEVKAKAEAYIHLGYQRLVGFEVPGGGFDWFGHPPANLTLTAYGVMEFQDMAKVHPVDPQLIERTRAWLLKQRSADGSWAPEPYAFSGDPALGRPDARLLTTAYVAWAVFGGPGASSYADATRGYLLAHKPESLTDPYVVALVANALSALDPDGGDVLPYLDRLEALKQSADDGKLVFWQQPADARTAFYGAGRGGAVETTALATLALLHRNRSPETTRRALAWLVKQKDAAGTWPSTQATVLALKALVVGSGKPAGDGERRVTLVLDGRRQEVVIPKDQAEVMKQIDLSAGLKPGPHRLTLTETSGTAAGYQVAFRYHVPDADAPREAEALGVRLSYDRTSVRVAETVRATATVTNRGTRAAPMVVVELPVPAGFAFDSEGLAALLKDGKIEKYQSGARGVVVYLRGLETGHSLALQYGLRATLPAKVSVPPTRAYEYYDPDRQGSSAAAHLTAQQ